MTRGYLYRAPRCYVCRRQAVTTDPENGDSLCASCYTSRINLRAAVATLPTNFDPDAGRELVGLFLRGRLTLGEWMRLSTATAQEIAQGREVEWQKIVDAMDCTCQPALPDGREIVCSFCEDSHNNRIAEIEL